MGVPSDVAHDPVLQMATPSADGFAFSEDGRLFHVALTRARRTMSLATLDRKVRSG